jgi:hypothetical protein
MPFCISNSDGQHEMPVARVLECKSGRQRFAVVAQFGARHCNITAAAVWAEPAHAESVLVNAESIRGNIAVMKRGAGTIRVVATPLVCDVRSRVPRHTRFSCDRCANVQGSRLSTKRAGRLRRGPAG